MIRELGETIGNTVLESVGRVLGRTQEQRPLSADILESDDAYLVVFDAPDIEEPDVQVRFENGAVEVRLDRFREFRDGYEMRFPGRGLSLAGTVRLPDAGSIKPSEASATLTQYGTLQVRIPRADVGHGEEAAGPEPAEGHDGDAGDSEPSDGPSTHSS